LKKLIVLILCDVMFREGVKGVAVQTVC